MPFRELFEETLTYTAPSHGDWGLVRIASLLPESHMIFFCPSACGRHGALGAVAQGFKDRVAYCFLDREDIIGGIDDVVRDGVSQLLAQLPKRPRVVLLYVSCLDDLIGTDLDALAHELAMEYPDVLFRVGHMNPISLDGPTPPPVSTQDMMYGLLGPLPKDRGVNFIGNFVPLDERGELHRFLRGCGVTDIRHISMYATFDGFLEMARSSYNFVMMPAARLAASHLEERLGTPFMSLAATYDVGEISEQYRGIADFLGARPTYGLSADAAKAEEKIRQARAFLGGRPVSVSGGAVLKPFALARALLRYGFCVESVVTDEVLPFDEGAVEEVLGAGVALIEPTHTNVIKFAHRSPDALAIGFDAAYITGSRHIVNLSNDHTVFGYHGVGKLMDMMAQAGESAYDLETLLKEYGVVL
ncbi:MAG: nitrogenase component 1 [Lachnospiraceae bacterium]|jgi:nitrogenase molybdenum-iron protein alpha/beta subunit|nr:nitrogenase component 1 [Lachnospiraceae bacterium]